MSQYTIIPFHLHGFIYTQSIEIGASVNGCAKSQNDFRYDHRRAEKHDECGYNQNEGYVVFSAMGSFFIPMAVMVYVYARISCVVAARHDHMTEIEVHKVINR